MEASRLQEGHHAAALCESAGGGQQAAACSCKQGSCCSAINDDLEAISWHMHSHHLGLASLPEACCACPPASPDGPDGPAVPAALPVPHLTADNWAVALTDIARLVRAAQPDEAYECLQAAAHKYAQSLEVHPNNPQASNNWGLVLQDLSSLRPAGERAAYLHHSLQKFRRALRLRPDFDRACYNLGEWAGGRACGWVALCCTGVLQAYVWVVAIVCVG